MIRSDTHNLLSILNNSVVESMLALDIGGSCLKMAYLHPQGVRYPNKILDYLRSYQIPNLTHKVNNGLIHFMSFETEKLDKCIELIKSSSEKINSKIFLTGGGAEYYKKYIETNLKTEVIMMDEMDALVFGIRYFISCEDTYYYHENTDTKHFESMDKDKDALIVNFGTGVSIVQLKATGVYQRVGGSSVGGGTFWGLCKLMMECPEFDELLNMCLQGNHNNVDMLVKDIYRGKDYKKIGLSGNTVAASFGKALKKNTSKGITERFWNLFICTTSMWIGFILELPYLNSIVKYFVGTSHAKRISMGNFRSVDVANSVLYMICMNIGQIAVLYARIYNIDQIVFTGSFVKDYKEIIGVLSDAVNYWSKGKITAKFTNHHAYISCIGCLQHDMFTT